MISIQVSFSKCLVFTVTVEFMEHHCFSLFQPFPTAMRRRGRAPSLKSPSPVVVRKTPSPPRFPVSDLTRMTILDFTPPFWTMFKLPGQHAKANKQVEADIKMVGKVRAGVTQTVIFT